MKKFSLIIIIALVTLSMASFAFALTTSGIGDDVPTDIDGTVYSDGGITPLPGVTVDVTCEGNLLSDVTSDPSGEYFVEYVPGDCSLGEEVTACVGTVCNSGIVEDHFTNLNILGVDIFNVPEFSLMTA